MPGSYLFGHDISVKMPYYGMVKTYESRIPPSPNLDKVTVSFEKLIKTDLFAQIQGVDIVYAWYLLCMPSHPSMTCILPLPLQLAYLIVPTARFQTVTFKCSQQFVSQSDNMF